MAGIPIRLLAAAFSMDLLKSPLLGHRETRDEVIDPPQKRVDELPREPTGE
jgi:hypothetical protein